MKLDHRRLAAAALLVGACAHPPLAELDAAWRAYQTASSAGAAEKSPDRFQEAGAALVEGQDFIDQGNFDEARESLKKARRLADAASGGQSAPRDEGLAEPRSDAGFTDAPTSNEGVQLSPLVKPGGAARSVPEAPAVAEPAAPSIPSTPSVPPPPPPAPPAAAPSAAVPSTMVDGALPERIEAPASDAALDEREFAPGDGSTRSAPTPEDTARAIREERERLKRAADERAATAPAPEPAPVPEPAPEPEERAAPPAAPAAPAGARTYVVKKGETLYEIARAQYKSETAWKAIYEANRDRLQNPGDVRAGMKLVLPPASAVAAGASETAPAAKSAAQTYTVRKGENLHTIADKMYGSQSYWTLIRDANKDKLTDVDEVRAGTKLVLPPKPGSR